MSEEIRFTCTNPACKKRLKASREMVGKRARCSCGQSVVIPSPEPEPLPLPEPLPPDAPPPMPRRIPRQRAVTPANSEDERPARRPSPRRNRIWIFAGAAVVLVGIGFGVWALMRDGSKGTSTADGATNTDATYEEVIKNPDRYVGKRVTWTIHPWEGSGKEILCTVKSDISRDHYLVEFASNEEVLKAFNSLIDISKPHQQQNNVTATFTGLVERPLTMTRHGAAVTEPKKVKIPLLSKPVFGLAEVTAEKME